MSSFGTPLSAAPARLRPYGGWTTWIVVAVAVLLVIGVQYNILYTERLSETSELAAQLLPWLIQQLWFMVVGTTLVFQIGKLLSSRRVDWWVLAGLWLLTGGAHLISGIYSLYSLSSAPAELGPGEIPLVLSVFPNEAGTLLGEAVNWIAIDELIHLGLFGWVAAQWLKISAPMLIACLLLPYVGFVFAYAWFFRLITG